MSADTKDTQAEIVVGLLDRLKGEVLTRVFDGKLPYYWQGPELRQYLSDKLRVSNTSMSASRKQRMRKDIINRNL